jgi:hypothetical protein
VKVPFPLRALLAHIVDYAGMFPPASLTLEEACETYARELVGSDAWLMGKFVVGVQHLDAMVDATPRESANEWKLCVIAGTDANAAIHRVHAFNARWAGLATVAVVEFPPTALADVAGLTRQTGDGVAAFFETPIDADLNLRLDTIAAAGAAAKVRTGGTAASAIPTPAALADFLYACAERGLAFKATAGLHHAVRSCYPLTYERNSATSVMHGFLNVVAAVSLAAAGAGRTDIEGALVEPSAKALFDVTGAHDADATRRLFRSFGSCSFREPARELAQYAT